MHSCSLVLTCRMQPTRLEVLGFLSGLGLNMSSDITLFSVKRMEGATYEYSAKRFSATSGPGSAPGLSTGSMLVNSSLKLETSVGEAMRGTKGAGMF